MNWQSGREHYGSRALRAALDSSPLWGAGRVEDTYNLLGHAVAKVISVIAAVQGRGQAVVAREAGAELVTGSSLKASLDRDWDQKTEQQEALAAGVTMLQQEETWLTTLPEAQQNAKAQHYLNVAKHVKAQNVNEEAGMLIEGVARDRRCSIEDEDMRHGRKSKSVLIDGYKRHVLHDLDTGLVRAVGITAANAAEASVTEDISADLAQQAVQLKERHIDRAYLSSHLVRQREPSLQVYCKAWPVRQGPRFSKQAFHLDWDQQTILCPASVELPFTPGGIVHFPVETCGKCLLREQCTTSPKGRSVSIHPDEALLAEFRERQSTTAGRATLRERVAVEHTLAHVGQWQGRRARYHGLRKNLFDLRRYAVVHNLHVLARSEHFLQAA